MSKTKFTREDALRFHLMRCSSNLTGPTDNLRQTDRQVLAVTHLAQVAASADEHHVVAKTMRDGATLSTLQAVVGEARVAEIARMLGGVSITVGSTALTLMFRCFSSSARLSVRRITTLLLAQ